MTIDGRVEARITIPTGGSAIRLNLNAGLDLYTYTIPAGGYFASSFVANIVAGLSPLITDGAAFTGSISTGPVGTGKVTFGTTGAPGGGTWTLNFLDTGLLALLGFAGDILTAASGNQTGTSQMRGLWLPDSTLTCDTDPRRAPKTSDLRTTVSPTGGVLGVVGNVRYRHKNVMWPLVPLSKVWEQAAVIPNASWETFFNDTQLGQGLTYFTPSAAMRIYDHTATQLGADLNAGAGPTNGWQLTDTVGIDDTLQRQHRGGWTGLWRVTLPTLLSSG